MSRTMLVVDANDKPKIAKLANTMVTKSLVAALPKWVLIGATRAVQTDANNDPRIAKHVLVLASREQMRMMLLYPEQNKNDARPIETEVVALPQHLAQKTRINLLLVPWQ